MARYFLESSALVKRHKQERGTDVVDGLFDSGNELFYLNLALIEVRKVFYRLWKYPFPHEREMQLDEQSFRALEAALAQDIREMKRIVFTHEMLEQAVSILDKVWLKSAFDLAQLAAYLITKEEYPDLVFVCSDERSNLLGAAGEFVGEESILTPSG